jgi:hypothetical protein
MVFNESLDNEDRKRSKHYLRRYTQFSMVGIHLGSHVFPGWVIYESFINEKPVVEIFSLFH